MTKIISMQEVKKHKNKDNVWIIIHDDVYDVTSFLEEHPGGEDSLLDVAGKDGTQGFEDVGHSEDARQLLKKYKIGTLPADEKDKASECRRSLVQKSDFKLPPPPRIERRVHSIIVPKERVRPRRLPCDESPSCRLKWAVLALAGALLIGFALKKYLGNK